MREEHLVAIYVAPYYVHIRSGLSFPSASQTRDFQLAIVFRFSIDCSQHLAVNVDSPRESAGSKNWRYDSYHPNGTLAVRHAALCHPSYPKPTGYPTSVCARNTRQTIKHARMEPSRYCTCEAAEGCLRRAATQIP